MVFVDKLAFESMKKDEAKVMLIENRRKVAFKDMKLFIEKFEDEEMKNSFKDKAAEEGAVSDGKVKIAKLQDVFFEYVINDKRKKVITEWNEW